mmetsp:Transcript_84061/g.224676  ORF Transcript_84061/g.224676 Transcript_84061/m.224676 type:complete len:456 (+) Transcript_84061:370-1737(+)
MFETAFEHELRVRRDLHVYVNYSAAMLQCRDYSHAEEVLRDGMSVASISHPGWPRLIVNLLHSLERQGKMADAERLAAENRFLLQSPELGREFAMVAAGVSNREIAGEAVEHLLSVAEDSRGCDEWFAAAKHLKKLGDVNRAVGAAKQGNRRALRVAQEKGLRQFAMPEFLDSAATRLRGVSKVLGDVVLRPARFVMIVGVPRSGTTLLESVLGAAYPGSVGMLGETAVLHEAATGFAAEQARKHEPAYVPNFRTAQLLRQNVEQALRQAWDRLASASWLGGEAGTPAMLVSKWPFDIAHAGFAAALFRGDVRILHCRRSYSDVALSAFLEGFKQQEAMLWAFSVEGISRLIHAYHRLTEELRRELPERIYYEVNYEELVSTLNQSISKVVTFLGLPWDDTAAQRASNFHLARREVLTASRDMVRQPITSEPVGRWREVEDEEVASLLRSVASIR